MPLRQSTRERRKIIFDDLMIFLRENEENSGILEDDPISFHQAMESYNSHSWIVFKEKSVSLKDSFRTIMALVALFILSYIKWTS